MKKLFYLFVVIAIIFFGCNKDENPMSSNNNNQVSNIIFEKSYNDTINSYQQAIIDEVLLNLHSDSILFEVEYKYLKKENNCKIDYSLTFENDSALNNFTYYNSISDSIFTYYKIIIGYNFDKYVYKLNLYFDCDNPENVIFVLKKIRIIKLN